MLALRADVEERGMLDGNSLAAPAREAPIEEAPVPTLLRLDADFCLELARELLRSEL